jgi:hypothetical protein
MAAVVAKRAAINDALTERLGVTGKRVDHMLQTIGSLKTRVVKGRAYRAFIRAGGARSDFERLWLTTYAAISGHPDRKKIT